jgi:hypothetical protein
MAVDTFLVPPDFVLMPRYPARLIISFIKLKWDYLLNFAYIYPASDKNMIFYTFFP